MMGGAFLYTNKESISLGMVVGMDDMRRRRDGTTVECAVYAAPMHDARGGVGGDVAAAADPFLLGGG